MLKKIFYLYAGNIPLELQDACLAINDEFPLHSATGIVYIPDNGNAFSEWLKTQGFTFSGREEPLAVSGT